MTLSLLLALAAAPAAPQRPPFVVQEVTIDGTRYPKGAVVIGGKTYLSQDALAQQGLTVLKEGSVGLYRFQFTQGAAIRLRGCLNEWLFDGVTRLRAIRTERLGDGWQVFVNHQTTLPRAWLAEQFQADKTVFVLAGGAVVDPAKNALGQTGITPSGVEKGGTATAAITVQAADITGTPPVRVVLKPLQTRAVRGSLTLDLSPECQKGK